jgi:two-component system, LytTR family, sensor kinase
MRFEERLRTEFRIDPAASLALIPSMLLQPLVENAIKYGVSAQEEGARISVAAQVMGSRLRLTVSDTGPGVQGSTRRDIVEKGAAAAGHSVSTGVGPRQYPRSPGPGLWREPPVRNRHPAGWRLHRDHRDSLRKG